MARAIVYTDFDGVLNAFPEAEPTPSDLYSPERAFRLDGEATVHVGSGAAYRIRWSSELTDALHELACTGAIELQWLSTWQPYTALLNERLGWNAQIIGTVQWYDPITYTGLRDGKYRAVARRVEVETDGGDPAPIVWIDDEECTRTRCDELRASAPVAPVLMVRPDSRIGISRRQWALICAFIANPRAFVLMRVCAEGHGFAKPLRIFAVQMAVVRRIASIMHGQGNGREKERTP